MASVQEYYGISESVPFINVDVEVDTRLFIDPHAVRLLRQPQPFADAANLATQTFFDEVARSVMSGEPADHARGLDLLQHFVEPWETRLGLASTGFRGHGGAAEVGEWIWSALRTDVKALLRIAMLKQIEDLPLFVEGIDKDITSDLTTRIIFEPLAMFTSAMIDLYPQFSTGGHRAEYFERQVWDSQQRCWSTRAVRLPVAGGKPLLLVPVGWARRRLLMSAGRYYDTSVLSYAQLEQAVVLDETGKLLKSPKWSLKGQAALRRGRSTNLRVTTRAQDRGADLLEDFRRFVDGRYVSPRDAA